ncbi:helix-turn-helix transcriptional regulator [Pseudomonas jilinensis]|uniref:AlpA family transcriptional regulator n=1 Tax=Pseudomonas jilinensis TaxID=2078689 RepID=A0A396S4R0_9PSED|nr:AlpA family transcriptional regulator [Pseudomonas jilinensis]
MSTTLAPQYITDVQIAAAFAVSRSTVWRWVKEGRLPQPVKLSPGCTRWRLDQIQQLQGAA